MKGLFFHGVQDIRYDTLPDPKLTDASDVLVRTIGCSICGSDLHWYNGHYGGHCGFSIGHEAVGEVMEVGSAVRNLRPGDEVIVSAGIGCGRCSACLARNVMSCETYDYVQCYGNGDRYEGSQAEAFVVPYADTNAIKIPDGVTHEQALMLTDMVPTAWLGVHNAEVKPGDTVVVIGLGPIGLTAVELAFLFGASQVIAVGRMREDRMAIARSMGAITVKPDEAIETIRDLTKGRMAHSVVETAGAQDSILMAMNAVRRNGIVSMVSVNVDQAFPFPMATAIGRSIAFRPAACSSMQYWDQSIALVQAGKLHPERLISDRIHLSEGPDAYRRMAEGAPGILKSMMTP